MRSSPDTQNAIDHPGRLLDSIASLLREVAAREVMPRFQRAQHSRKTDGSLMTEADLAAQQALVNGLNRIIAAPVLAEEMSAQDHAERWLAGGDGLWCIDPIDGTSNFVSGLPYFALSVAFMHAGRSLLGVVFNPVADEMFCAAAGSGAHLNGVGLPLRTHVPALSGAMAAVDFKRLERRLAHRLIASPPYMSQRSFGASALEWCYTAAGRFDIYLHGGQKLWDYAAGALILSEAGGHLGSLESDDFWSAPLWNRSAVAALDPALYEDWKTWLRDAVSSINPPS
jgi:myo-inositol-1(or 4)-monophosphatase